MLSLGDVQSQPLQEQELTFLVINHPGFIPEPDDPAGFGQQAVFGGERLTRFQTMGDLGQQPLPVFRMDLPFPVLRISPPGLGRKPEQGLDLRADIEEVHPGREGDGIGDGRDLLHQGAIFGFAIAQGFFSMSWRTRSSASSDSLACCNWAVRSATRISRSSLARRSASSAWTRAMALPTWAARVSRAARAVAGTSSYWCERDVDTGDDPVLVDYRDDRQRAQTFLKVLFIQDSRQVLQGRIQGSSRHDQVGIESVRLVMRHPLHELGERPW